MKVKFLIPIYSLLMVVIAINIHLYFVKAADNSAYPIGEQFSVLSSSANFDNTKQNKLVYGFLPYWQLHNAQYLHFDKLTDIALFALTIEKSGEIRTRGEDGNIEPGYNQWRNNSEIPNVLAKAKENKVRTALTITSHEDEVSDYFLNCEKCWDVFMEDLLTEMNYHGVKDLNLDFEYSSYTTQDNADKYTNFAEKVNEELDKEFGNSYVVVSTYADSVVKARVTDVEALAKVVDGLFIMAYDFHYRGSEKAGPVSPIDGMGKIATYDIRTMIRDYTASIPPSKLIMGVPYYGYNWVTLPQESYAIRLEGNDYIGYSNSQSYEYVIDTLLQYRPALKWDPLGQVPYFSYISTETGAHRQVYYENVRSLALKYNLIKENNLAGVGIWALGYDGGYQELWDLLYKEFPRYTYN